MKIPFVDLQAEYLSLQEEIDAAIFRVMESGCFILGEEVRLFEKAFAKYCGVQYAIGVGSVTDALFLTLKAMNVGPGDEVVTVAYNGADVLVAIEMTGAKPVFVDLDPVTYTLDPFVLDKVISKNTKVIIPTHLFGHPADMDVIMDMAQRRKIGVIEDCTQAHGAVYKKKKVGSLGHAAVFSFYPTKNLGGIGDGGMVITNNNKLADTVRLLTQYGWQEPNISAQPGYNSRLDSLQAAVLQVKLTHLDVSNKARRFAAQEYYNKLFTRLPVTRPQEWPECEHVYHLYVIQSEKRDELRKTLQEQGIATAVHYPVPLHLQPAYTRLGYAKGSLPVTERLSSRALSLPIYPTMPEEHLQTVGTAVAQFFQK